MSMPNFQTTPLPTTTTVPEEDDQFISYFNKTYADLAYAINSKDTNFYPIAITSSAQNIPAMPNFGAFIVCVSGVNSTLPTLTASCCKADSTASGSVTALGSQVGTGAWAGNALTITSTATNFQIHHNRSGVSGNFNIKIIGTQ